MRMLREAHLGSGHLRRWPHVSTNLQYILLMICIDRRLEVIYPHPGESFQKAKPTRTPSLNNEEDWWTQLRRIRPNEDFRNFELRPFPVERAIHFSEKGPHPGEASQNSNLHLSARLGHLAERNRRPQRDPYPFQKVASSFHRVFEAPSQGRTHRRNILNREDQARSGPQRGVRLRAHISYRLSRKVLYPVGASLPLRLQCPSTGLSPT